MSKGTIPTGLQVVAAGDNLTETVTVKAGSFLRWRKLT